MIIRSLALLTILLLIFSCAGGLGVQDRAPDWVMNPVEDGETEKMFRGIADADTLAGAKSRSIEQLRQEILKSMNLGDPEFWSDEGRAAVDSLFDKIERMIRTPDSVQVDGVTVVNKDGWKNSGETISYGIDLAWNKEAFDRQTAELRNLTRVVGSSYQDLENRARAAESDGNVYESALIWAAAAGIAEGEGNTSGFQAALKEVEAVLIVLDFQLLSVPDQAYVGTRPEEPVLFAVSAGEKPVGNGEFVITYPRSARDGSESTAEARILSDREGVVRFLPPEISFTGIQTVTIAPSADPFLEYLEDTTDAYSEKMVAGLEKVRAEAEYEALPRIRTIPTGILILETDLAGNALNTADAARGMFDDLAADGFDIDIMNLNPSQMLAKSESALLRDLKADTRFSDSYDRVIHGTVTLESFDQDGDSYSVRVSGTLAMSDINRQITLFRSEITKTSRASDSQQAMSAAFRQLGRSFAGELIEQAP